MTAYLEWLENTSISTTLRDSPNVFLYPSILAFHTLGLAFLVGISTAISLRILGVAPGVSLAPMKKFFPFMWLGLFLNAASGALLLVIEPTKFLTMLDFYVKMAAIVCALVCIQRLYARNFRHPVPVDPPSFPVADKALAVAILVLWGAAITGGRLTAYDDVNVQWQTAVATAAVSAALLAVGYVAVSVFLWLRAVLWRPADVRRPVTH
jgi:hypothetical protein